MKTKATPVGPIEGITEQTWRAIEQTWNLGPQHVALLDAARSTWLRWCQVRKVIDREGVAVQGRYRGVPRVNPLLGIESRLRESLARILTMLDLKDEGEDEHA